MRVAILLDVLEDTGSLRAIERIVDAFLEGRHVWDKDNQDQVLSSPWFTEETGDFRRLSVRESLEKLYTESVYSSPVSSRLMHQLHLVITRQPDITHALLPDEARRLLESPAYVVVEDATSDGTFLRAMMHALGRDELAQALAQQWWEIEHAGGKGGVEKRVAELIKYKHIPADRILVIADSDRLLPCQDTETVKTLTKCGSKHKVTILLLHKREIENYLPISVLQRARQRDTYRAFLELNQEQRDHYDMKDGFKKDKRGDAILPQEQRELFGKVRRPVLQALCGGFGPNVYQLFDSPGHQFDAQSVEHTCTTCPREIDGMLDQIERLL
ncbi:hypothetical protein [Archangium sp.]|uniref:hypothetical protein n=1 Tax=Archangium sp. TaxID=1872627 RepID=UPI002D6B23CF|nr:hypothetical protein [Archangium sp.]HYO52049.1 hypothetical protein [Archangium sp.]